MMALNLRAEAVLPCSLQRAAVELESLDGYPTWLGIVLAVQPSEPAPTDPGPAWWVDLGGRLGPVRKTKRVRMVRTLRTEREVRFERGEIDGRTHNRWVLEARLTPEGAERTQVEMTVEYSGDRRVPVLDRVLRQEVGRAGRRLVARVAEVG
jgi:hypothetical protein